MRVNSYRNRIQRRMVGSHHIQIFKSGLDARKKGFSETVGLSLALQLDT